MDTFWHNILVPLMIFKLHMFRLSAWWLLYNHQVYIFVCQNLLQIYANLISLKYRNVTPLQFYYFPPPFLCDYCYTYYIFYPWTARRSNQSILKEISPGCSLEGLMLKLKLQYYGHLMRRADSFGKTLMLGKIKGPGRRG